MGKMKAWQMDIEEAIGEVEGKDLSEVIFHVQNKVFPKPAVSTIKDIYKKTIQDLTEQLYTAYKRIKELTDKLNGTKVQETSKEKEKHYG